MSTMVKNNKKKLIAGAVAGVAALALISGGTFALWSDFDTIEDNFLGAGTLVIEVGDSVPLNMDNLAPGENKTSTFFLANRGDLTEDLQDAALTATVVDLRDIEDGCPANSEREIDPTCAAGAGRGEFTQEAYMQYRFGAAVNESDCAGVTYTTIRPFQVLSSYADGVDDAIDLGDLNSGEGICIRIEAGLPGGGGVNSPSQGIDANAPAATNLSQGDSATFDVLFDLTQNVPS